MKNSYFLLNTINQDNYTLSDIFSTNRRGVLPDLFISDNEDAFYYIIIPDDTTLDAIAYNEYERSDYWDLLFKINQMTSPFDLPKSHDYLDKLVEAELLIWKNKFTTLVDNDELLIEKKAELLTKYFDLNEQYRKFRCIKPSYIKLMFQALNNE